MDASRDGGVYILDLEFEWRKENPTAKILFLNFAVIYNNHKIITE